MNKSKKFTRKKLSKKRKIIIKNSIAIIVLVGVLFGIKNLYNDNEDTEVVASQNINIKEEMSQRKVVMLRLMVKNLIYLTKKMLILLQINKI